FSSGAGRTSDGNGSHASTLKSPSYTKSVSWQHYRKIWSFYRVVVKNDDGNNARLF
ncbi:transposase, partial [Shigella flexneri]